MALEFIMSTSNRPRTEKGSRGSRGNQSLGEGMHRRRKDSHGSLSSDPDEVCREGRVVLRQGRLSQGRENHIEGGICTSALDVLE